MTNTVISYEFVVRVGKENEMPDCCHYYGLHTPLHVWISMRKCSMICSPDLAIELEVREEG